MRQVPQGLSIPAALTAWLGEAQRAIGELQVPGRPQAAFTAASSAPPMPVTNYQNCTLIWTDLKTVGFCDGLHWYRCDTGGVII